MLVTRRKMLKVRLKPISLLFSGHGYANMLPKKGLRKCVPTNGCYYILQGDS